MVTFIYLLIALAFLKLTYDAWKWTAVDDQDAKQAIHKGRSSFIAVIMVSLQSMMPLKIRRNSLIVIFAIITVVFFILFGQNFEVKK